MKRRKVTRDVGRAWGKRETLGEVLEELLVILRDPNTDPAVKVQAARVIAQVLNSLPGSDERTTGTSEADGTWEAIIASLQDESE